MLLKYVCLIHLQLPADTLLYPALTYNSQFASPIPSPAGTAGLLAQVAAPSVFLLFLPPQSTLVIY